MLLIIFSIVIILVIYVTVLYVRDLRTGKDSFIKKTWRWIKDVIDVLFGLQ